MDSSGQFAKPMVIGLHCAHQVQAQMSITALQHSDDIDPADRLDKFHLYFRIVLTIACQEFGDCPFDDLRGRCHSQSPGCSCRARS